MKIMKITRFTFLLICCFWGVELQAQTGYNTNAIPLGNKESLMGNTGTGGVASAGATYYNPGALTQLEGSSISLSGAAYTRFEFAASPFFKQGDTELDYQGQGFQSIPTSAVMLKSWKNWRLGFSVLIPMKFKYEGVENWSPVLYGERYDIEVEQSYEEQMMLIGLSAARKLNDKWSVGVSGFAQAYSQYSSIKTEFLLEDQYEVSSSREKYAPYSLRFIAGVLREEERWSVGASVSFPDIYMSGKGDYKSTLASGTDSTSSYLEVISFSGEKAHVQNPFECRIGGNYKATEKWKIAVDFVYTTPVEYNVFDYPEYNETHKLTETYRFSLGNEIQVQDDVYAYLGASYVPTPTSDANYDNRYSFFSATTGFRKVTEHVESTIGLFYAKGSGKTDSGYGFTTEETFVYYGVFLGTSYVF